MQRRSFLGRVIAGIVSFLGFGSVTNQSAALALLSTDSEIKLQWQSLSSSVSFWRSECSTKHVFFCPAGGKAAKLVLDVYGETFDTSEGIPVVAYHSSIEPGYYYDGNKGFIVTILCMDRQRADAMIPEDILKTARRLRNAKKNKE